MLFVPSPQALLHGNHPNYKKQDSCINILNENSTLTEQEYRNFGAALIDHSLLTSSNSRHPDIIAYFNSLIAIGSSLHNEIKYDISSNHLFFGLLSLQCSDIFNAIHFLNIAAKNGNNSAINLLSKIHFLYQDLCGTESSVTISKNYLMNSYRRHSNDSLFQLGEIYNYSNNYILSLYFFYHHFRVIDSSVSVLNICQLLKDNITNEKLTRKWMLYSISRGEPKFIESVIYGMCGDDSDIKNYAQISNLWKSVISNFYQKISSSHQPNDDDLPKSSECSEAEESDSEINIDIFVNSKYDFNADPNLELIVEPILDRINDIIPNMINFCPSILHIKKDIIQKSNMNVVSKKDNYISFYPSKNKAKLILEIFELVSSDFQKRNLKLAEILITELFNHFSNGILSSEIFKLRSNSKNHKWLTSCAFIYLLIGDIDSGFRLFLKASKLGNFCATMMCGFLLFHWKHDQEKMKKDACFFFLKCASDPIALIHLSFILNDSSMLDRACAILGIKSRIKSIYWLINLLIEGTKMPSLFIQPAKIICIAGIEFGLRNNEDTTDLYDCYIQHFK